MGFGDILSGVGNVLDTPGSILRGLLSGQADKAFGGILDPSQRVSGRDLTDKWGVTDANSDSGASTLAGLAAQIGTDPLMYLGGPLARLLGGGAKAAEAASAGKTAMSSAEELAAMSRAAEQANAARTASADATSLLKPAPGVGGYQKLADGTIHRLEALPPAATQGIGAGGEALGAQKGLTDAEAWAGRRAGDPNLKMSIATPGTLTTDAGSASSAGPLATMLGNRRDFTVLKDVGVNEAGNPTFSRAIGGMDNGFDAATRARQVFGSGQDVLMRASDAAKDGSQLAGAYSPANRTATIIKYAPEGTLRHETGHGLMDAAFRSGTTDQLPSWLARKSAALQLSDSPTARALGQLGEETWTNAIQSRGAFGQARNAVNHLMNPVESYAQGYNKLSPFVGNLYRSRAIPMVPAAAAGAAGGGALASILSGLGGDQ